jgi:hypothetical protein
MTAISTSEDQLDQIIAPEFTLSVHHSSRLFFSRSTTAAPRQYQDHVIGLPSFSLMISRARSTVSAAGSEKV